MASEGRLAAARKTGPARNMKFGILRTWEVNRFPRVLRGTTKGGGGGLRSFPRTKDSTSGRVHLSSPYGGVQKEQTFHQQSPLFSFAGTLIDRHYPRQVGSVGWIMRHLLSHSVERTIKFHSGKPIWFTTQRATDTQYLMFWSLPGGDMPAERDRDWSFWFWSLV